MGFFQWQYRKIRIFLKKFSIMLKIGILGSGSKGNSLIVSTGQEAVLVDAGFSRRELLRRLGALGFDPATIRCVLLTHEHTDHISGAPVFCDTLKIPLCAAGNVLTLLKRKKSRLPASLWSFEPGEQFNVGSFQIGTFPVQHDATDPVGFVIGCGGIKVGIATDLGEVSPMARRSLVNTEVLVLESNYDPEMLRNSDRRPGLKNRINGFNGHLDNRSAARALDSLLGDRSELLLLAHRSCECNTEELVREEISRELSTLARRDFPFAVLKQEHCLKACRRPAGGFDLTEVM